MADVSDFVSVFDAEVTTAIDPVVAAVTALVAGEFDDEGGALAELLGAGGVAFAARAAAVAAACFLTVPVRSSMLLGANGRLIYRGYRIGDLVEHGTYPAVANLLWTGDWDPKARLATGPCPSRS